MGPPGPSKEQPASPHWCSVTAGLGCCAWNARFQARVYLALLQAQLVHARLMAGTSRSTIAREKFTPAQNAGIFKLGEPRGGKENVFMVFFACRQIGTANGFPIMSTMLVPPRSSALTVQKRKAFFTGHFETVLFSWCLKEFLYYPIILFYVSGKR